MDLRKIAIPVIAVLLAALGYSAYRYLNQPTQQVDDFRAILNLTPGDLLMNCGQPIFNTIGVVGNSAGVQDLHYKPSETDEIVFRFITIDDKKWQSLGAWEHVNSVDVLGVPVSASDAVHREPCAGKATDHGPQARAVESGGWTSALATALNPVGLQEMLALAQEPPQSPWVVRAPSEGFKLPPPHANPFYDPGASGIVHIPQVCPPGMQPCLVVSYAEFVDGMNRVISAEEADDFSSAVDRLTRHGTIVVQLPPSGTERDAAINGVVRLEVKAINIAAFRLRDDILRLAPTDRDSGEMKTKKVAALTHNEQVRRLLWKQAVASNRPTPGLIDAAPDRSKSSNNMAFVTRALERMAQIHETGVWP